MTPPPGYGLDLDALVNAALERGERNYIVPERSFPGDEAAPLLVIVLIHGRLDLAQRLFEAGSVLTAEDTARTLWWGDVEKAAFLLRFNAPINEECVRVAVRHGKWEVVLLLLDKGADLTTPLMPSFPATPLTTRDFYSPLLTLSLLHAAAWDANSLMVRELLRRGAAADRRDGQDMTPLMAVCRRNQRENSPECAFYLLEQGADPNAATPTGETPLLFCTGEKSNETKRYGRNRIVRMLLRHGANPNVFSPRRTTPLMFAARDNDVALARALLDAGADISATTPDGITALDAARRRNSHEVAELLRSRR